VPIASTNGGEALTALVDGKFAMRRLPDRRALFTKGSDSLIDHPNRGWKGRGLWTTCGTPAVLHSDGGVAAHPEVIKLQIGPSPPAD
jgi:hypothetical protein